MSVGLDIGSTTIKITELSQDKGKWRLKASGIVGYKGTSIDRLSDKKEYALLSEAIKRLHKEAKISSKQVAVSLPESQVFTRVIKLPLLNDSEIASAVKWEAEQYIPIPADEAIIRHRVLERREDTTPPSTRILLIAAPRDLVDKYSKVVEKAGLRLVAIESELMSLVRSLAPEDQTVMIADLGARSTDIAISTKGQLSFSRSVSTGGEALTRSVAQSLGVEPQQAEEYKKTYGLSGTQLEGKIKSALDPVIRMMVDEMKKAVHFYKTESQGAAPKAVILSGGATGMPEISQAFSNYLGLEVVIGNPFTKVSVDPEAMKALAGYGPLYSVSVGLAMRDDL